MNLASVEARKSAALDAWRRGALADADTAYAELAQEYERHHFAEGLLAVRFNHLLVALEAGDRPRIDALMTSLGGQLLQLGEATPLVQDVAQRICRLFVEPVPGVDHQATNALVALATDKAGQPPALVVEPAPELPEMGVLLALQPEDSALLLLRAALRHRPGVDEPEWLTAVRQGFAPSKPLAESAEDRIRDAAESVGRDDLLRGYPALVDAFEWAVEHAPDLAAEWAIGLSDLEARGLPERLRYVPTMPQDRRQRSTVALHARLAETLSSSAGSEALARQHWAVVETLGQAWLASARARAERGGGRADDFAHVAEISMRVADALRHTQRIPEARALLAPSVARARRDAFDDRTLAARILVADARLLELSDPAGVRSLWTAVLDTALPGATAAADMEALARIVDRCLGEAQAERGVYAVEAWAGLARTGEAAEAMKRLRRARIALAMLRPALSSAVAAQAALVIELSGARLGDGPAAARALEAAHVVGDRPAAALALLHAGERALEAASTEIEQERAFDTLAEAAAVARRCAAAQVRRAVEAAVARAHRSDRIGARPARVNIHVRRAIEAAEGPAFEDGAGRWDGCLPADDGLQLAHAVNALLMDGNAALARRLCTAGRGWTPAIAPSAGAWTRRVQAQHRAAFRANWLGEGVAPEPEPLHAVEPPEAGWSALHRASADVQIELRVLPEVTYLFGIVGDVIRGHRIDRSERDWAADVDALRAAAHSPGTRLDAVGTAVYHRLLGPVADLLRDARRVLIVPDGPLFDLPFALLRADRGCLGEHLELVTAVPAPTPAFDLDADPAPATAMIIGDDATARDLRISTLSGQGFFRAVDVRHGADLGQGQLAATIGETRVVHVLGELTGDCAVGLIADEAPTSLAELAGVLGDGGAVCATLMGPVEGERGRAAVGALLPGVRGGILMRRWHTDEDGSFLLHFLAGAAHAVDSWALAEALAAARRATMRANLPPAIWAAYSLTVALD